MGMLQRLSSNNGLIVVSLGNLIGAVLTGGFWFILAALQNAEDYGKVNYEVALASFAAFGALMGLHTMVTTYIARGSGNINLYANQIALISGLAAALIVTLIERNFILGFFVVGMTFWMMSTYELLGRKKYKQYAAVVIGTRGAQLVLGVGLY